MDAIGLDTVAHIENHYVQDRGLPSYHLQWLEQNYLSTGKLGLKSTQGGLYPPAATGTKTRIFLLNTGLVEPFAGKTPDQIVHSGQILAYTAEDRNSRPVELVANLPVPDGIDISHTTKRVYWTHMGTDPKENNGSIQSANLDGSDVQYVLKPGELHTGKQMTIDQSADKIYFTDREGLRVMRCNLDGSEHETIYQTGDWRSEPHKSEDPTYWPVGITLSKRLNRFFWTQKGHSKANEGRIFSAGLEMPSGSNAATRTDVDIIIEGLPECIDLEFDDEGGVLYWTDRGELPLGNTLNKKQIIGEPSKEEQALGRQIIAQGLGEGIGLRLDRSNDCLYVADMGGRLWKCATKTGLKEKLYEGPTHTYTGIAFYKF